MSLSFFAFLLSLLSIDVNKLSHAFKEDLPVRFLGGFQIFFAASLFMLWIGKIIPSITKNEIPIGLEHYTTLVIQGLDLGFIVPASFLSGILLIKKKTVGYLLSSAIIMKGFTMGAALTAMIIGQYIAGVKLGIVEILMFPVFSLVICYCLFLLLKDIDNKAYIEKI